MTRDNVIIHANDLYQLAKSKRVYHSPHGFIDYMNGKWCAVVDTEWMVIINDEGVVVNATRFYKG